MRPLLGRINYEKITKKLFTFSSLALLTLPLMSCHNEVFKVTFKDRDGNVIYETNVKYGGTAQFVGDLPTVPADKVHCYPFVKWSESIENVTSNLEVTAVHGEEYNIYDFDFVSSAKVFNCAETFDENTTNFIGYYTFMGGIMVEFKEAVIEDGEKSTCEMVPIDSELVSFDYTKVDTSKNGVYPYSITVEGLTKESTIEVVTDTRPWKSIKSVSAPYKSSVTGPDFDSYIDGGTLYEGGGFLFDSLTLDEFDPFFCEEVEENVFVITSEDGVANCKYMINEEGYFVNFGVTGSMHNIVGTHYDWVQFTTASEFTEEKEGYAFLKANILTTGYYTLTVKYEYNQDTKEVKLYAPIYFNSLQYNTETGQIEYKSE